MLYPEISHFNIKSLVFKTFALNVIQTTQKILKREIFQFQFHTAHYNLTWPWFLKETYECI